MATGKASDEKWKEALSGTLQEALNKACGQKVTFEPIIETKPLDLNDEGMMPVSGFQKFAVRAYIAVIKYFHTEADKEKDKYYGLCVAYFKDTGIIHVLKAMGLETYNWSDDRQIKDKLIEFCRIFNECLDKTFTDKLNVHPLGIDVLNVYRDTIPGGMPPPKKLKVLHELTVKMWDMKPFVIDVIMDV